MRIMWCASTGISVSAHWYAHSRTLYLEHAVAQVCVRDVRRCQTLSG